jgi:hypothetical protein
VIGSAHKNEEREWIGGGRLGACPTVAGDQSVGRLIRNGPRIPQATSLWPLVRWPKAACGSSGWGQLNLEGTLKDDRCLGRVDLWGTLKDD